LKDNVQFKRSLERPPPPASRTNPAPDFGAARPLRVLHVLHSVSASCGGPVENLWTLLKAAKMSGIHAAVATTNHDGLDRTAQAPFGRFVDVNGFQVRYFPRQTRFYTASVPMLRWLWDHVRDYDLVHVHALFSFAPVAAAVCARLRGVPYVVSPHGVFNEWGRTNRRPLLKRASIRCIEGPLLRRAARVQFTSSREAREFARLGIGVESEVIPLAMPSQSHEEDGAGFQPTAELHALTGRPTLLFLARIHPIKNLDMLLRAFAGVIVRHPSAVLLVAGDGESNLVARLRGLAGDLGLAESIHWIGFVGGPLKRWLFGRANVFVLPSWSENFGLAAAEAMAAGVPVIVTEGIGIADLVAAHQCGLVVECTAAALLRAIEALFDDAALCARMGQAGKHAVRDQLSTDVYARRLERMYRCATHRSVVALGNDSSTI
jgi:glycosyltransferase involved in cell wall biosynthesis